MLWSDADIDSALSRQRSTGIRLGEILLARDLVDRPTLYRHLAASWRLDFVDLEGVVPDPDLADGLQAHDLAVAGWVPLDRDADGRVRVAVSEPPTPELADAIRRALGSPTRLVAADDRQVLDTIHRGFHDPVVERATLGLWHADQDVSARRVLSTAQRYLLAAVVAGLVACLVLATAGTLVVAIAVTGVLFLVCVLFKFTVAMVGVRRERWQAVSPADVAALDDRELPRYTVLVPVYREANVIGQLIGNLARLDYPEELLEVLVLVEEDDPETLPALLAADPQPYVRPIVVPAADPRTKPKACNVGLEYARGELLVIYDAEDVPEPDQLKQAVVAFRNGNPRLVCVQAALNYWNAEENALTRMFTLEYSYWFDYMLPGLDRLRLPIPLGGTSNHFKVDALRLLGGWDPFNVTEDADLGIRVAATGGSVGVIHSTTFEEANRAYGNWIRQRSRWVKGYMQTLLVHLRSPVDMIRACGWKGTLSFLLLVGGTPLTFLATPPLLILFLLSLVAAPTELERWFPGWVLYLSLFNLLVGNMLMVYLSMMGAFKRRRYSLVLWALLNPVYWILHSIAAYKALWQLIRDPHYWEKTTHGLSELAAHVDDVGRDSLAN